MMAPLPSSPAVTVGTMLRERGKVRLVVVLAVISGVVWAHDQRTGRRTHFQLTSVGEAERFEIVSKDKEPEALRMLRAWRLQNQGAKVFHLADRRAR
jgi:hypothetical protein